MNPAPYLIAPSDRVGLTAVLLAHYPAAYRLATGLCGRAGAAEAVVRRVLDRAVVAAPRWASAEQAERWFIRFTVLTARAAKPSPPGEVDAMAWLRSLPRQQREAFVLHHGLGLDLHRTAVAMDCSSRAAANHLVGAVSQLRSAGVLTDGAAGLAGQLAAVVPPPAVVSADVARAVQRQWWRAAGQRVGAVVLSAGVVALSWAGWRLWQMLVF